MEGNKKEVIFLLKGKDIDREVEIDSGETSIRKAIKTLSDNWGLYELSNSQFGEIESLRIVLRQG